MDVLDYREDTSIWSDIMWGGDVRDYIQKCPECGKFYFNCDMDGYWASQHLSLSYPEIKLALFQWKAEGGLKATFSIDEKFIEEGLRNEFRIAYCSWFYKLVGNSPTKEDIILFRENVMWIIEHYKTNNDFLKAELYREIGNFELASKYYQLSYDNFDAEFSLFKKMIDVLKNQIDTNNVGTFKSDNDCV